MRLDAVLDAVYVMGSLWSAVSDPQVCPSGPYAAPKAVYETTWSSAGRAPRVVTAFVDVNVVPMDSERVLPDQTV